MGNQEPARAVADRFNITRVNRILIRLSQAVVDLSGHYIKWPDGEYSVIALKLQIIHVGNFIFLH